jgi:hypothetical protein
VRQCLEFGFRTGHPLAAAEIIATMFEFWLLNDGYLTEGRSWLDRALSLENLDERADVHALLRFHQALLVKWLDDEIRGLDLLRPVLGQLARHRPREFLEASAAALTAKQAVLDPSVLDEVDPTLAAASRSAEDDDVRAVRNAAASVLVTWGRYDRALALSLEYDRRGDDLAASSLAALLTVRTEAALGHGELATAAELVDTLTELLDEVAHVAEQDSPRRAIAVYYLVSGHVDTARRFLDEAWTSLKATHPRLALRFTMLQVLLAEAQRRSGEPEVALHTLCGGLSTATGRSQFRFALPAVLEAALLAADLGDVAVGRQLALRWDTTRRELGLPVPVYLAAAAADTLGLDATPPAEPTREWRPDVLHTVVASARSWCAQAGATARQPDRRVR